MRAKATIACLALALLWTSASASPAARSERPPLKDFMGLCGHYFFDGPTYAPVAGRVRNYHSLSWDLDVARPYADPPYPFALNRVNWQKLYGAWRAAGFDVDASIVFGTLAPGDWQAPEEQGYRFGRAFGRFFGPSGGDLVSTVELGNEPGRYSDRQYGLIAHAMARGLKEGDPRLRIATANLTLGSSDEYARSISCYEGWLDLIDVLNVHTYAIVGKWPDRRRTYPEEPGCDFLRRVRDVLDWRDAHAPGKEVWVTEFGWDAHREEGAPLQAGVPIDRRPSTISRLQQAQFLARACLLFARMGVDRAYVYWYMDAAPGQGLHNASGLISSRENRPAAGTRHPAYYALASLRRNLGDYRFGAALEEDPDGVYAYRFEADTGGVCIVFWTPTLEGQERAFHLALAETGLGGYRVARGAELATTEAREPRLRAEAADGALSLTATGTPRLVFLEPR